MSPYFFLIGTLASEKIINYVEKLTSGQKILYSSDLRITESFAIAMPNDFMSWIFIIGNTNEDKRTTASAADGAKIVLVKRTNIEIDL
jgi:hypothetical protein